MKRSIAGLPDKAKEQTQDKDMERGTKRVVCVSLCFWSRGVNGWEDSQGISEGGRLRGVKEKVRGEKIRTPAWALTSRMALGRLLSSLSLSFHICVIGRMTPSSQGCELLYIRQLVGVQHC